MRRCILQNGRTVPTLSLRHCLVASLEEVRRWACLDMVPDEPCHDALGWLGDDEMGRLLDEAGEERFRLKAGRFAAGMGEEPPSQVLYRGIMGALGYTKNKEQFEELACRLPLAVLEGLLPGQATSRSRLLCSGRCFWAWRACFKIMIMRSGSRFGAAWVA